MYRSCCHRGSCQNWETNLPTLAPRTWRCKDSSQALDWAKRCAPNKFDDIAGLTTCIAQLQHIHADRRSCAERRLRREPQPIKDLRHQLRTCTEANRSNRLKKLLFEARVSWLNSMLQIRRVQHVEAGRPVWKSKKLFPIRSMTNEAGEETLDHEEWAGLIENQFGSLWKCGLPRALDIQQWCGDHFFYAGRVRSPCSPEACPCFGQLWLHCCRSAAALPCQAGCHLQRPHAGGQEQPGHAQLSNHRQRACQMQMPRNHPSIKGSYYSSAARCAGPAGLPCRKTGACYC